ncbi:class I SAM-dependent methyltransferase, partial [Patescibacteria group bacterium]|nr:class I SAM-dependent methyltransferase [Patescibacteria group bacterium]
LGTGDGRFVFTQAKNNPNNLHIGVDPSAKQLEVYSKKANKERLENVLFGIGSIEHMPQELNGLVDELYIILPWGTLLEAIVKVNENAKKIPYVLKKGGKLKIILGYTRDTEPSETKRLNLQELTPKYIDEIVIKGFENLNLTSTNIRELTKKDLQKFESTWSKKLAFGKERPIYLLSFTKK